MKSIMLAVSFIIVGCLSDGKTIGPVVESENRETPDGKIGGLDPLAKPAAIRDVEAGSKESHLLKCDVDEYTVRGKTYRNEEIYSLGVLNAKLKYFPAFQKALKTSNVETCGQARTFMDLYNGYYETVESYEKASELGVASAIDGNDATGTAASKTGIYGAIGVINKKGVVYIESYAGGLCTGYMISSREIVTAAHCVMGLLASGHSGTSNALFIEYYDPALPAGQSRPLIGNEYVAIHAAPTYAGGVDTQSDIAVITRSVPWNNTTAADYLKMYTGTMSQARYNHFYGNGLNGPSDQGAAALRYERVYVDWYGEHHYIVLAYGHRVCGGDSGGPFIRDDATDDVVTGHLSNHETTGNVCSVKGDKERATRLSTKVGWINGLHQNTFGLGCATGATADNHGYVKCF